MKQSESRQEQASKASAHQQQSAAHSVGITLPSMSPVYVQPKSQVPVSTAEPIQLFPYSVKHNGTNQRYVIRFAGNRLTLYRHGIEVAYFEIQVTKNDWGMKNIFVHGDNLQGQNIGTLLLYFIADLAQRNGMQQLTVLTPSGQGLWTNNGFVATPRGNGPPDIVGNSAVVAQQAGQTVLANFTIGPYVPDEPAKKPPPNKDPRRDEDRDFGKGGIFEL